MNYDIVSQCYYPITVEDTTGNALGLNSKLMPADQRSTDTPGERHRPFTEQAGSGETILLVEDMVAVRNLAARVLRSQDYRVIEATDGVEALELLAEQALRIDLVLTDMVMPRLGGLALAEQLALHYSGIKVMFMSGYADEPTISAGIATSPFPLLAKPFSPTALLSAVRDALAT